MRLHRLQLTAFGPFPGTEAVDLDALSRGGLFLLHGPTGAGKTTVLDAVCFALYGRVPGVRAGAVRLRSDHADPGVAPEVVCEFSVGSRRLEVTRSPAWERPKKRGEGTTTQQARVVVREWDGADWQPLTTRSDEAGHLLDGLLGLGLDQFTKLVLLPQGEFAAFLRADAEARRHLLERLFGTDRFTAVQDWVRQHQRELRRDVEAAEQGTRELLAQARQAAAPLGLADPDLPDPDLPDPGLADPDLTDAGSPGGAPSATGSAPGPGSAPDPGPDPRTDPAADAVQRLRRSARHAFEEAVARRAATQAVLARADQDRRRGEELAARHRELRTARLRLAELHAGAQDQERRRRRLEDATRAAGLAPAAQALDAASRLARTTAGNRAAAESAAVRCSPLPPEPTADALADPARATDLAGQARQELARLVAAEQDEARLTGLESEAARLAVAVAADRAEGELAEAEAQRHRAELDRWRVRRDEAATTAARGDGARAALRTAEAVLAAVAERDRLQSRRTAVEQAREDARRTRDDAREHWLDLRERRLAGIAAELAAGLGAGTGCPVCGSTEHPHPAAPAEGTAPVDRAAEEAGRQAVDRAQAALDTAEQALADLRTALAAVTGTAGELTGPAARAALAEAAAGLRTVEAAHTELADAAAGITAAEQALADATGRHEQADARVRSRSAELAAATELAADLRRRVDAARGEAATVAGRRARVQAWSTALEAVLEARAADAAARARLTDTTEAATAGARAAGFTGLEQALAAVTDPGTVTELRTACRVHDDELAAVTARLADPDLAAAAERPAPAVTALVAAEELARSDDEAAAARVTVCETAVGGLDRIAAELAAQLRAARPVVRRFRTAEQLSRCLEGTGGDNTRRMSLSAYVLAARLEQVAQAAGQRLAAMSGGRYTLVHSDDLERGRGRSGLSLRVVDGWTGAERETASLSGGESFYTSLALALGLADVVTAESGGAVLETLFVDEGFGSLDEETLDEVMDVLDGLRTGGRAVGLVSHVPDLRQRIPARLEVVKTRTGSRLLAATS